VSDREIELSETVELTRYEVLALRVVAALEQLGPTAQAVADSLRREGIQGERHCSEACPVWHYLARKLGPLPGGLKLAVNEGEVLIIENELVVMGEWTTEAVMDFVHSFDFEEVFADLAVEPPHHPDHEGFLVAGAA
jgi:hypothetical protein